MYKKRTSNNLIFINPNLEQDAQASVPDFYYFFAYLFLAMLKYTIAFI